MRFADRRTRGHRFLRRQDLSGSRVGLMKRNKPPMHGGVTRKEFEGMREDLQNMISEHPRAKFTFLLLDREGHRTEDMIKAARYGLTVYEDGRLIYEELGRVVGGLMVKE